MMSKIDGAFKCKRIVGSREVKRFLLASGEKVQTVVHASQTLSW